VVRAIREPVEDSGRAIASNALLVAAQATEGYPFLIQLVGQQIWRQHAKAADITMEDVQIGVATARRRLGSLIHEPTLAKTSEVDRSFLAAMAQDDGPSTMNDITARLGVDKTYASQYRLRLIDAELIRSVGFGKVNFVLPYLREYLREHATSLPLFESPSSGEVDLLS
jgi:hypothetical protein